MSGISEKLENNAVTFLVPGDDWRQEKAYRIHLLVTKDDEDTYSAIALNLPGAGSCGATGEEAIANAKEAVREVLKTYEEDGKVIPWKDSTRECIPFGAEQKWIILNG